MATTQPQATTLESLLAAMLGGGANSARGSSSSTTAFNNQAGQGANQLLQQIAGLTKENAIADSTGMLQELSQNILRQQLPSIANQGRGAGLYNSTTQQQLLDNLQAQTTSAMTQATGQNIANYAQAQSAAANALAGLNNSSREQFSSEQRGQSASDMFKAAGSQLLVSQGLGALRRNFGNNAASSLGSNIGIPGGAESMPMAADFDKILGGLFGSGGGGGAAVGGGGSDGILGGIGNIIGGGAGGLLGSIGSGIGDVFSGIGNWTGWWANGGRIPGGDGKNDGKDNMIGGFKGGEVVLPVDTVQRLDSQFGEDWVDKLIAATHTKVTPKPTAEAKQAAAKAIS